MFSVLTYYVIYKILRCEDSKVRYLLYYTPFSLYI